MKKVARSEKNLKPWKRAALRSVAVAAVAAALSSVVAATAPAAPPTLTLTATDGMVGQTVHSVAQLSGTETPTASGEISFEVFGPNDSPGCSGPALTPAPASAPVNGEGEYASGDFTPPSAGTYHWIAHYSGDVENAPADSTCATSVVGRSSPSLSAAASSATVGTAIHDEATLTGGFAPTGEVTFSVYAPGDTGCSTPLQTSTVPIQGGHATSSDFTPQQVGGFRWTASYPGDGNNESAGVGCGAANQTSVVAKAAPTLTGTATSAAHVGLPITDSAVLAGGFEAGGQLLFRAYGPDDQTCTGTPAYEEAVAVSGDGSYAATGFSPGPGLYRWTVEYGGDSTNEPAGLLCGASNQASAVGTIAVTLAAGAADGTVGTPLTATATIAEGAIPAGSLTFRAFSPGDSNCSGIVAFTSTVAVSGNGPYSSTAFIPTRVGVYRWTVEYSGDVNHAAAAAGCGVASSRVSKATPSISGQVRRRPRVGAAFRDAATVAGGYSPGGTITFRIYGPGRSRCAKPDFVDTVAVAGNGTFRSAPFIPERPGRYTFVASYSGDSRNQAATEPCGTSAQIAMVQKRAPRVRPRARLLGGRRISIRARLSGAAAPSGVVSFRLYGPGDERCRRTPVFRGGATATKNGVLSLGEYLASRPGRYRLTVGYSGDPRNTPFKGTCGGAQSIQVS